MNLSTSGLEYVYDDRFTIDWWNRWDGAKQSIIYLVEPAKPMLSQLRDWLQTDQGFLAFFVLALVGFVACIYMLTRKRNGEMKQATVSDIFLEAVDLAYLKGQITRTERRRLYKQLADFFHANDLLKKNQSSARTKGLIRWRLGNVMYQKSPKIPGPKPLSIEEIKEKRVKVPVRNRMSLKSKVMRTQPA